MYSHSQLIPISVNNFLFKLELFSIFLRKYSESVLKGGPGTMGRLCLFQVSILYIYCYHEPDLITNLNQMSSQMLNLTPTLP